MLKSLGSGYTFQEAPPRYKQQVLSGSFEIVFCIRFFESGNLYILESKPSRSFQRPQGWGQGMDELIEMVQYSFGNSRYLKKNLIL